MAENKKEKKFCISCGAEMKLDDKFCTECGGEENHPKIEKKDVIKKDNNKFPTWAIVGVIVVCISIVGTSLNDEEKDYVSGTNDNVTESSGGSNSSSTDYSNLKKISSNIRDNFISACKEINMKPENIKSIEKLADWNSGPRYSFVYESTGFILYAYDNGDISSINIGTLGIKVYDEKYESLNVNDYIVNMSSIGELQIKVEKYTNYPNSVDFDWITTGAYSRKGNFYYVGVDFSAKNSYGMESDHNAVAEIYVKNGSYTINCLKIDSSIVYGNSKYKEVERKERKGIDKSTADKIILKEGIKGNYGQDDLFDGEKYIRYYIPAGTYNVKALTKNAHLWIETIKIHKEDGFDTATIVKSVKLNKVGDSETITIKSTECISLVVNTQVELTKK